MYSDVTNLQYQSVCQASWHCILSPVPSLAHGWITATLCIMVCQTPILKGYRECRRLQRELFTKLHDVNITHSTYWRISIVYLCVAELTIRSPFSVYKIVKLQQPSYLTCLLSPYKQLHVLRSSTSDLLSTQSSLTMTNNAARQFSRCAPTLFGTVFTHLYAQLTVSLVLGRSSKLKCSQDICSRSRVHASRGFCAL